MTTPIFAPDLDAYEPSLQLTASRLTDFVAGCIQPRQPIELQSPFDAALGIAKGLAPAAWLTLSGVNGCGKTMLARQAFGYVSRRYPHAGSVWISPDKGILRSRRPKVIWIDEVAFVQRCKEGEFDLPEYLGEDWLVVLDDLGASRDKSGFAGEMLFRLCNARVGKFTLFTTNLTLSQVSERVDPRIASRLIRDGNLFCEIAARDYAVRQIKQRASA